MGEIYGRNRSLRTYFSLSRFPQQCRISKGSQTSPVCLSLKSKSYTELCVWSIGGMMFTGEDRKVLGKESCSSGTLYTINFTWTGLGSKPGLRG